MAEIIAQPGAHNVEQDPKETKISRRGVIGGAIGLFAVGGAAGVAKMMMGRESTDASLTENVVTNVTHDEQTTGEVLSMLPDLYVNYPYADPDQLLDRSIEERQDLAGISLESAETHEDLAEAIGQRLSLIAAGGRDKEKKSFNEAQELGYISQGEDGSWTGDYSEYLREYFVGPMLDGLFALENKPSVDYGVTKQGLEDFILSFAGDFYAVAAGNRPELAENAVLRIDSTLARILPATDYANNRMALDVTIERPIPVGVGRTFSGEMIVDIEDDGVGYILGIESMDIVEQ